MVGRSRVAWSLVVTAAMLVLARPAMAGSLNHLRDYVSRQQANLTSGERHQVFFSPITSLPGSSNTVVYQFPDADDGSWCRGAGSDLVVVGITDPEGATEGATALPGTLTGACTIGSGTGSFDTITITGVGPLTAGTVYGWSASDGSSAKLGTPPPAQGIMVTLSTTNGVSTVDTETFFISVTTNDQVLVTATVANTTPPSPTNPVITFSGFSAPDARVTISRDDQALQTSSADSQANFSITLSDQPTGSHVYVVSGRDADGHTLASVTFALSLQLSTTTLVNGVFLGPSIGIDHASVLLGSPVTIFGTTVPSSAVTLTVNSVSAKSVTVTAGSTGAWSAVIQTSDLSVGTHTAKARSVSAGTVSSFSQIISFSVGSNPAFGKLPSDINVDGHVNIVDFSIMLFYWLQRAPANVRVDINGDGIVNLIDFSILLYQWTD